MIIEALLIFILLIVGVIFGYRAWKKKFRKERPEYDKRTSKKEGKKNE